MGIKWANEDWENYLKNIEDLKVESIDDYINMDTPIRIKFIECGHVCSITPHNFKNRQYCHICKKNNRLKTVFIENENNLFNTHPHIFNSLLNKEDGYKYSFGSEKKVDWKCENCNNIIKNKRISDVVRKGFLSCPICSDGFSLPNKIMYSILNMLKIEFQTEFNPDWCLFEFKNYERYGYYDFYFKLNNEEYIIEMDGDWHKKDNQYSGQTKEESKYIDEQKDKLAKENNIEIIRIDCLNCTFDVVKNQIIKSKISKLFDLKYINWDEIFKNTIRPIVYDICNEFNMDNNMSSIKLAEKFKLTKPSIIKYLKQGNKIGICNYNPYEQMEKRYENKKIQVICLTTNKIYNSIKEAALDIANNDVKYINKTEARISQVCRGLRKYCGKDKVTNEKLYWQFYS